MMFYTRYFIAWAVNSLMFLLASSLLPSSFVLGNASVAPVAAAILNGFLLTFATRIAKRIIKETIKGRYLKFVYYFLANSATIWILARFASILGFGISAFYYAFYLGIAVSLAQWLTRQVFKKAKLI